MNDLHHRLLESHFRRPRLQRIFWARPRLIGSVLLGIVLAVVFALLTHWRLATQLLVAWNVAVILYLVLMVEMMGSATEDRMKLRAKIQDEGQGAVLALTIFAVIACMSAIVIQLSGLKDMTPTLRSLHVGLAALTIVSAWFFVHSMFALHYAHEYYGGISSGAPPCLEFPGHDPRPDYGDFIYFSFIIGTSAQTADVSVASKALRRINIIHCILAFFFNTTLLALTINIAASLIS